MKYIYIFIYISAYICELLSVIIYRQSHDYRNFLGAFKLFSETKLIVLFDHDVLVSLLFL